MTQNPNRVKSINSGLLLARILLSNLSPTVLHVAGLGLSLSLRELMLVSHVYRASHGFIYAVPSHHSLSISHFGIGSSSESIVNLLSMWRRSWSHQVTVEMSVTDLQ